MKTVKTLHFDFVSVGVSLSVSFGYAYNWSLGNDPFVYILPTLMGEQQHITLLEGKQGMERMTTRWTAIGEYYGGVKTVGSVRQRNNPAIRL